MTGPSGHVIVEHYKTLLKGTWKCRPHVLALVPFNENKQT